jgi:hypothetical protein
MFESIATSAPAERFNFAAAARRQRRGPTTAIPKQISPLLWLAPNDVKPRLEKLIRENVVISQGTTPLSEIAINQQLSDYYSDELDDWDEPCTHDGLSNISTYFYQGKERAGISDERMLAMDNGVCSLFTRSKTETVYASELLEILYKIYLGER